MGRFSKFFARGWKTLRGSMPTTSRRCAPVVTSSSPPFVASPNFPVVPSLSPINMDKIELPDCGCASFPPPSLPPTPPATPSLRRRQGLVFEKTRLETSSECLATPPLRRRPSQLFEKVELPKGVDNMIPSKVTVILPSLGDELPIVIPSRPLALEGPRPTSNEARREIVCLSIIIEEDECEAEFASPRTPTLVYSQFLRISGKPIKRKPLRPDALWPPEAIRADWAPSLIRMYRPYWEGAVIQTGVKRTPYPHIPSKGIRVRLKARLGWRQTG